tara:strand:+ start:87 stop:491 length:405 start_codon:yes stop_codon:yes gene_type:complete
MSWHERASVTNLSVGDIVLSYDINEEKIVEAEIIDRVEELYSDGKETFAISTGDYGINLTIFHIVPYYRDGELILDNCGTIDVGDELIIIDEDELAVSREKVISVEQGITDNQVVYHPISSNGYYFINRILLHD